MFSFSVPKKLFITATDTGVGKTYFISALALYLFHKGKNVAIVKPIQTGKELDTTLIKKLTQNKIPIFNSYTLKLPAAPTMACKYEKKKISIKKIIQDIKNLEKKFDVILIEGIGGVAVPISNNYLVSDLIKRLRCLALVVSRPDLGTINHTVLTLEHLKEKKIKLLGFVISNYPRNTKDLVIKTAYKEIEKITNVKCLGLYSDFF